MSKATVIANIPLGSVCRYDHGQGLKPIYFLKRPEAGKPIIRLFSVIEVKGIATTLSESQIITLIRDRYLPIAPPHLKGEILHCVALNFAIRPGEGEAKKDLILDSCCVLENKGDWQVTTGTMPNVKIRNIQIPQCSPFLNFSNRNVETLHLNAAQIARSVVAWEINKDEPAILDQGKTASRYGFEAIGWTGNLEGDSYKTAFTAKVDGNWINLPSLDTNEYEKGFMAHAERIPIGESNEPQENHYKI